MSITIESILTTWLPSSAFEQVDRLDADDAGNFVRADEQHLARQDAVVNPADGRKRSPPLESSPVIINPTSSMCAAIITLKAVARAARFFDGEQVADGVRAQLVHVVAHGIGNDFAHGVFVAGDADGVGKFL